MHKHTHIDVYSADGKFIGHRAEASALRLLESGAARGIWRRGRLRALILFPPARYRVGSKYVYRERLPSGRRTWTLRRLSSSYPFTAVVRSISSDAKTFDRR